MISLCPTFNRLMGRFSWTSPAAEKPTLDVVGYGGTIMSMPDGDLIVPKRESLDFLIDKIPKRLNKFGKLEASTAEPFIDSASASADDIMNIVADVRRRLGDPNVQNLIVLYGSDSMGFLMGALGNGISKKEIAGKSVIVTCSMNHVKVKDSDAITNFNKAITLALHEGVRGKLGLLFDERFFPPFGIEKPQISKTFAFVTRFQRMAKYDAGRLKWRFDDREQNQPFDDVRGNAEVSLMLTKNVHPYQVTPMTDYSQIAGQIRQNKATILIGMGDGNLRCDNDSIFHLRTAAETAHGPIVVVGSAIYNAEEGIDFPKRKLVYQGNGELVPGLISGGAMTLSEAMMIVSMTIAKAEAQGTTDKQEIHDLVEFAITSYPFRDLQSSKVKNRR